MKGLWADFSDMERKMDQMERELANLNCSYKNILPMGDHICKLGRICRVHRSCSMNKQVGPAFEKPWIQTSMASSKLNRSVQLNLLSVGLYWDHRFV